MVGTSKSGSWNGHWFFGYLLLGKKDQNPGDFLGKISQKWVVRSQTPGNCRVPCDSCHETRSLDTIRSHGKIVGKCPRGSMIFLLKPPCLRGLSIAMFDCYRLRSSLQPPIRFVLNLPNILMGMCFSIFNYLIACGKPAGHSHLVHRDILYEPSA